MLIITIPHVACLLPLCLLIRAVTREPQGGIKWKQILGLHCVTMEVGGGEGDTTDHVLTRVSKQKTGVYVEHRCVRVATRRQ